MERLKQLTRDFPLQNLVEKEGLEALLEHLERDFNCINELTLDFSPANNNLLEDKKALAESLDYYLFLYEKMESLQLLQLVGTVKALFTFNDRLNEDLQKSDNSLHDLLGYSLIARKSSPGAAAQYIDQTYTLLTQEKDLPQDISFKENSLFANAAAFFVNDASMVDKLNRLNACYHNNRKIKEIVAELRGFHRLKVAQATNDDSYWLNNYRMKVCLTELLKEMSRQFPALFPETDAEIENTDFNQQMISSVKKTKHNIQFRIAGLEKPKKNSFAGVVANMFKVVPVVGTVLSDVTKGVNSYDVKADQKTLIQASDDFNQALDMILTRLTQKDFFSFSSQSNGAVGALEIAQSQTNKLEALAKDIAHFMQKSFFANPNDLTTKVLKFKQTLDEKFQNKTEVSILISYHFLFSLLNEGKMLGIGILDNNRKTLRESQNGINCQFDGMLCAMYKEWQNTFSSPSLKPAQVKK